MTCPHCHENLPADYDSPWCPYCGKNLEQLPKTVAESFVAPSQSSWLLFWVVLLMPAMIDFSLMTFISNSMNMLGIAVLVTVIGSVVCGIICGSILAHRKAANGLQRALLAIICSAGLIVVSFCLCFLGCNAASLIRSPDNNF